MKIDLWKLHDWLINVTVCQELEKTGQFDWMDMRTDENEHSIEMHLPYIAKVMEKWVTFLFYFTIYLGLFHVINKLIYFYNVLIKCIAFVD